MQSGDLPALARLRDEGSFSTVASVFPSVTGPAYTPFLIGRHPGSAGLPGLRWYDRAREACSWPGYARSYTGSQCRFLDSDLAPDCDTMFELADSSVGALSVIRRGLAQPDRIGSGLPFLARTAVTHFRGNVAGWLDMDRATGDRFVRHVRQRRPEFAFAAFTGTDKSSHAFGHRNPLVLESMRVVDDACARLRADAERANSWNSTHLWVVSDHGHSDVHTHDDIASHIAGLGWRTVAHPWIAKPRAEVLVAVSGNAMAHIYTGLTDRSRRFWPSLSDSWSALANSIAERDSVDLMLLPLSDDSCAVRSAKRGEAVVKWGREGSDWYSYLPQSGDPLGIGEHDCMDETDAFAATANSNYPDALVQIARLASCSRSGDIILSATPGYDFRASYEPITHASAHGALHRDHMLVPLLASKPLPGVPRRTVDVMASACAVLGVHARKAEGTSFV